MNWLMDDDVNLFDSLACLLDEDVAPDDNNDVSDLESCIPTSNSKVTVKTEKGNKSAKKRKFNPDSDVIAAATDETLKSLDVDPNSKEGKMKRRQIRNRLSAQFHRDRKNAHIHTMEEQMAHKDMEIASLKSQITTLLAENEYLRSINPSVSLPLQKEATFSSFPESGSSNTHTDVEDGDSSVQSVMYFLNPSSRSLLPNCGDSISSTTVSAHNSPYHTTTEASLPSIHNSNLPNPLPMMQQQRNGAMAVTPPVAGTRIGAGQGAGMIQVPGGIARPLSIITMVCMMSIMLLGGTQTPGTVVTTLQYSPYQQQQAAQHAQYVQYHLNNEGKDAPLTVGSNVLALMHTNTGTQSIETRVKSAHTVDTTLTTTDHVHGRRLSEVESSDEASQSSEDSTSSTSKTSKTRRRSRSNSLYSESLSTEEEAAAATAISALRLFENNNTRQHNNLRRSYTELDTTAHKASSTLPERNYSRQVIFSSGVVNRGLVEDSYVYHTPTVDTLSAHVKVENQTEEGEGEIHTEEEEFHRGDTYNWPASQAFGYTVQSYSKVVLTEGQALLDPSLELSKNPFSWTRAMFRSARQGEDEEEHMHTHAHSGSESGEDSVEEGMEVEEPQEEVYRHPAAIAAPVAVPVLPSAAASAENGGDHNSRESKAIVPLSAAAGSHEPQYNPAHLPALLHNNAVSLSSHHHTDDQSDVHTEHSVLNKLLAESNFLTLKLPASSIRVGKSWGDSQSGTVENLMEVFNITTGDTTQQSSFTFPADASASVEINCIILGAKLVLSDTANTNV